MRTVILFRCLFLCPFAGILGAGFAGGCSAGSGQGGATADAGVAWAPDGADTDTWGSWSAGFFATYCIECHGASDPKGLDFGTQSIVAANRDAIRCGVCVAQDPSWDCPASPPAKQFPISDTSGKNPKPSDAERDRVVDWINAGCK
jgi:hypothetical protein